MTATIVRLVALAGLLGLTSGCDLVLGIPNLGDPDNLASMKSRFKATIQAEQRSPAPLDWGAADGNIWWHYMGPGAVAFCGRPANAPVTQRTYQIVFFRGSFGNIGANEVETPAHPSGYPPSDFCGLLRPDPS